MDRIGLSGDGVKVEKEMGAESQLSREPSTGLDPRSQDSFDLSQKQLLNQGSPPGAPRGTLPRHGAQQAQAMRGTGTRALVQQGGPASL